MSSIAVTGMSAGESPSPGLPVIRSLREVPDFESRVVGLGYDALESGVFDRKMLDAVYLLPYPGAGRAALLERVRAIHEREQISVILPNLDVELQNFISIAPQLERLGIRTFLPTEEQFKRRSKTNLPKLAEAAGILSPPTRVLTGPPDQELKDAQYPVVIKGAFYDATVAHTAEQALGAIDRIAAIWGYPILIQKYVPGEEFNATALGDGEGGAVGAVCIKKIVMTEKKKGWVCVTLENEKLEGLIRRLIHELRWRGPLEIEAILSSETGEFHVFEINPRFPQWIYIAQAAGANLPYAYLQLALGQRPEPMRARPGVVFSNYTTNLVTDLQALSTLFTNGEIQYANV